MECSSSFCDLAMALAKSLSHVKKKCYVGQDSAPRTKTRQHEQEPIVPEIRKIFGLQHYDLGLRSRRLKILRRSVGFPFLDTMVSLGLDGAAPAAAARGLGGSYNNHESTFGRAFSWGATH